MLFLSFKLYINGNICYMYMIFDNIVLRFIHFGVCSYIGHSFHHCSVCFYMNILQLIHYLDDEYIDCFQVFEITSNALMHFLAHVLLSTAKSFSNLPVKVAEQVRTVFASSHDHIKITTKKPLLYLPEVKLNRSSTTKEIQKGLP